MIEQQEVSAPGGATINAVDIARLAGVGRAAVSNWRKRYDDFPQSVAGTASSPLFDAEQIRTWLRQQGKLEELPLGDEVWRALEPLRGSIETSDALTVFGLGLRHVLRGGTKLTGELDDTVLSDDALFVEAVRERIESVDPGHLAFPSVSLDSRWAPLLRLLDRAAEEPDVFDGLIHTWAERSGRRRSGGNTPAELAGLMAGLADGSTVFDPFCNVGELLRVGSRLDLPGRSLAGQHPDPHVTGLATAALWLHLHDPPRIEVGDGLRADAFGGEGFESVVCVPPWGSKDWGFEDLRFDPRWEYGLPPRAAGELAWVQHALAHLAPEGVAVLALPAGVATQSRGRRIRAELLRRGALRCVVALPAGVFPGSSVLTTLWILRAPSAETAAPGGVLMIDGSRLRADRGADWQRVSDLVLPAWREFDTTGRYPEQPGVCRVVPAIDLLDDEVNLAPARHLPVASEVDVAGVRTVRGAFLEALERLPEFVPDVAAQPDGPKASTTVDELSRIGALTVLYQGSTGSKTEEDGQFTALSARDVIQGRGPTGSWGATGTREPTWLRAGDVVLPMLGAQLTTRVIADEQAVLGSHLWLLRCNPDQLDPWFLAGFLRHSANAALSSGSMTSRLDARRAELPRIPLEEQRPYAQTFRQLFHLETGLRRVQQHGEQLVTDMIDGLTGNSLRPGSGEPDSGNRSR